MLGGRRGEHWDGERWGMNGRGRCLSLSGT